MAFSFGGGGDTGSGFSFGNFGATTSGSSSTTAPAAGGFSFAAPSTSTPAAAGGFAFGAPAATTSTTTTAPASTGFAFGAPSTSNTTTSSAPTSSLFSLSSTPASTTTTTSTTAPATTGFNFSFGGDTGATTTTATSNITTTTAPTATAPLSFGFGDTGASTTTSTLPTFSLDTKPSTAPTTDAFSFAAPATTTSSSSSSSSTTTTSTTSTSTTTTAGTIDPSSRIKNKTVDEIINLWSRDLEDHVQSFTEQAIEVKKWDTQMIENLNKIVKLQGSVTNVQSSQVKLNRILETIKINQQDLTTMIDNLEKAVDQTSKRNLTPDEMKREEAYRLAEEIDSQLMVMSDSLQETVRTLNTSAERHADPNNPFTQILKILNIQMTSLQWIEQTSQQLEGELAQAQQVVRTAKADTRTTSTALNGYRR